MQWVDVMRHDWMSKPAGDNALWDNTKSFWDIKNSLSHERGSEQSERASERVSAAEGASEASSLVQAIEWAVQANKLTDERVAQYLRHYSCLFHTTVHKHESNTNTRNEVLTEEIAKTRAQPITRHKQREHNM